MKKEYLIGAGVGAGVILLIMIGAALGNPRSDSQGIPVTKDPTGGTKVDEQDPFEHNEFGDAIPSLFESTEEVADGKKLAETIEEVQPTAAQTITVNGQTLTDAEIALLVSALGGSDPIYGDYWYDSASGLYGLVGSEPYGVGPAGLVFPALSRDASAGTAGILINGREISAVEVAYLTALFGAPVEPAAYWLDSQGNYGVAGNYTPLGNLVTIAQAAGGSSGDNFWSSGVYSAGNYDRGNTRGYVNVPGYGAYGYGF